MKPVERGEVLGLADYEAVRERFRARVIEEKRRRRVKLGADATAVFENHDTVLLQIQEMLRTERITREAAVLHEIETYNALVPGPNELSATVFVEIDEKERRERFLAEAHGIEGHIALFVGDQRFPARWEAERELVGRASAVMYLRFPLGAAGAAAVRDAARGAAGAKPVALACTHPRYEARAELPRATLASLAEDLES